MPELLEWTRSTLGLDVSNDANIGFSLITNRMANSVDPDETAGSTLFARMSGLVCKVERVNLLLICKLVMSWQQCGPCSSFANTALDSYL